MLSNGAGGFVLILPGDLTNLVGTCRETMLDIEQELLSQELDVPVYFAMETPELLELYSSLDDGQNRQQNSALSALVQSISSSGYQLVVSAGNPQPLKVIYIV